jgi:ABC-2 type transport system ATP-binding protein
MGGEVAVSVQGLKKSYGPIQALRGVDLRIESGQIFGLLGPNGAGKTTLIRLLIGSSKRDSGEVSVLGLDPAVEKWALRRAIGYMQRVEETLEFVGLSGRANDPLYKLSGGMVQRVSLACAIVHQPPVLFLDEPTTGIDPKLRESFWQHFRRLASEGRTILVSTHQMDEVMYCDRLAILQEGELLAVDTPRKLLWTGEAVITIGRGGQTREFEAHDYPHKLPEILRQYGLEAGIDRIEIEQATLEQVVLSIIAEHDRQKREEN